MRAFPLRLRQLLGVCLVMLALGPLAAAAQKAPAQEAPAQDSNADSVESLQKQHVDTLRKALALAQAQYDAGLLPVQNLFDLRSDLLEAQLDMATTREERIKIVSKQLDLAMSSLAASKARFDQALISQLDLLRAESAALQIKIKLAKLRAKTD